MSRKSGMSFDEFVALAARAESIQRATRVSSNENKYSDNRNRSFYSSNNFSRPQSSELQNNSQQLRGRVVCYNCNEPGHLSRDCNQHIKGQRINNCIVMQKDQPPDAFCCGVQLTSELSNFLENELHEQNQSEESKEKDHVGKILVIRVETKGVKTDAMVDGGAQISLIGTEFLYKLIKDHGLDLRKSGFSRTKARIADVNGQQLKCFGMVTIPISRKGREKMPICFHITTAQFGYNLLFGTNSMSKLGFLLYDSVNKEMIEFEEGQQNDGNSVRIIFSTKIEPRTTKLIEIGVDKEWNGKDVIILPSNIESGVKVEPTVGKVEDGRVIAQITNYSTLSQRINEKTYIGMIEKVDEIFDTENSILPAEISSAMTTAKTKVGSSETLIFTSEKFWGIKRQNCWNL
ncbi:hypothetical protein niasHT_008529 [Heterodera trifolii]|uniref:CCHC-type domain-containing protein n=1 Tax=Heterodera trifolii TaxID=157864 RepID=A0ABD2LWR2_9BILA